MLSSSHTTIRAHEHRSATRRHSHASPETKNPARKPDGVDSRAYAQNFKPFSLKYLTAPGCHGTGEASRFCISILISAAVLCTAIRSGFLSNIVFTML